MGRYRHCESASVSVVAPARSLFAADHAATADSSGDASARAVQQLDDLLGRKPEALVRIAGTLQLSAGFQQHFHAIRTARGALGLTLHADGQR